MAKTVEVLVETTTAPQVEFWESSARCRAFVGGIGSGKTYASCVEAIRQPAGSTGMLIAPTYPMLRDATMRTFLDLAQPCGLIAEHHISENRIRLIDGKTILFRSADDPRRLRGPNLGWFGLDEAAMMDAIAWQIMLGRLREKPERAWLTTTPAGFNWVHEEFEAKARDGYHLIRAATTDNRYLSAEYLASLKESYSELFYRQEVLGEFVDINASGLFKVGAIEVLDAAPTGLSRIRSWDVAATEGGGDFTAGALLGGPDADGKWVVLDVVRGQWGPADRDRIIRQTAAGDGREVRIRVPKDPGAAGVQAAQSFVRLLAGYSVQAESESGEKSKRAEPFAAQVGAGNVRIVRGPWNRDLLSELRMFPEGKHDDQVDALSGAFNLLAGSGGRRFWAV